MKPRIVITVVTEDSKWEFSTAKGRPMGDGLPSPGPTQKQIDIACKAIADVCNAPLPRGVKIDKNRSGRVQRQTAVRRSRK